MAGNWKKTRGGLAPDKYLSEDQHRKLMKYVRSVGDLARARGGSRGVQMELVIDLLLSTGLRASEAVNLTLSDLPMSHGKCNILVLRDRKKMGHGNRS